MNNTAVRGGTQAFRDLQKNTLKILAQNPEIVKNAERDKKRKQEVMELAKKQAGERSLEESLFKIQGTTRKEFVAQQAKFEGVSPTEITARAGGGNAGTLEDIAESSRARLEIARTEAEKRGNLVETGILDNV